MHSSKTSYSADELAFSNDMLRRAYGLAGRPRLRGLIQQSVLPQQLRYRGFDMHVVPSNNFTEFTIWRTGKSPEETELDWIEKTFRGQTLKVLDVGGNAGLYSLLFASILTDKAEIHAFEPNPTMADRLERNCKLNGMQNVTLHRFALSAQEGEAVLSFSKPSDFASNLGQASLNDAAQTDDKDTITVRTAALAELEFAAGADFCKVDIEGHEADVLLPYFAKAPKADLPKYLQLETAHAETWTSDLMSAVKDLGYTSAFATKKNTIFRIG